MPFGAVGLPCRAGGWQSLSARLDLGVSGVAHRRRFGLHGANGRSCAAAFPKVRGACMITQNFRNLMLFSVDFVFFTVKFAFFRVSGRMQACRMAHGRVSSRSSSRTPRSAMSIGLPSFSLL